MDETEFFILFLVILVFLTALLMWAWSLSRGKQILEQWARARGYRIISSEHRWFRRGPFFWTTTKGQIVYYVVVERPDGRTRRGYVRCGSFFWGVIKDKVQERLEESV